MPGSKALHVVIQCGPSSPSWAAFPCGNCGRERDSSHCATRDLAAGMLAVNELRARRAVACRNIVGRVSLGVVVGLRWICV